MLRRLDLQQAGGQHVVEVADERGELLGLHALPEQAAGETPDVVRHQLERGHVGRVADAAADVLEAQALQGKQVALGDDAHGTTLAGDGHMADAVLGHEQGRVLRGVRGGEAVHGLHHDLRDGRGHGQLRQGHAAEDVVPGQDAHRLTGGVDHQHGADAQAVHLRQHVLQRRVG